MFILFYVSPSPRTINMEPEKGPLDKETHLSTNHQWLGSMLVFGDVLLLMEEIRHQLIWYISPLFTEFSTSQVVHDVFHQQWERW